MNKKESIKKYYYDIVPAYNFNGTLIYSSVYKLNIGSIVKISIRKKILLGCIVKKLNKSPDKRIKIKNILEVNRFFKLNNSVLDFLFWVSKYNLSNLGATFKLVLINFSTINPDTNVLYFINSNYKGNITKKQNELLKLIKNKKFYEKELAFQICYKKSFINYLVKKKIILKKYEEKKIILNINKKNIRLNQLTSFQSETYKTILKNFNKQKPIFLDGITGSGKTEIYFKVIKYYLEKNKQVLVLIPEIALSTQWIERFIKVFNFEPLVWNSSVRASKKKEIWQAVISGEPLVVVGSRSSVFLPFTNLGIIIVDEENDSSYKQEDKTIYNARDMAIVKAKFSTAEIILVSATPSIETYYNFKKNKYNYVSIKNRFGLARDPEINLIDMRGHKRKLFSSNTLQILKNKIMENKQVLILINRRGYAPITLCTKCGNQVECKYCDINLVFHKTKNKLICHHCGSGQNITNICDKCKGKNSIINLGFGIEKVAEEIQNHFKNEKLVSLSSDTFNSKSFSKILNEIERGKIKLIVGTQIISKGFNFLNLDSVFILDFDMWLNNTDIRTNEKIFQLAQQISGRTSRAQSTGEVFIQTYNLENNLLKYLKENNKEQFYESELALRKKAELPPYTKLIAILLLSKDLKQLKNISLKLNKLLSSLKGLKVLGPIPAPVGYINNEYRYRFLIKTNHPLLAQNLLRKLDFNRILKHKAKIKIDVDPISFF